MKILFISLFDPYKSSSGPGNHLLKVSEALSTFGCEIHLLVPGVRNCDEEKNGIKIHRFKPRFLGSLGNGLLFSILSIGKTNELIHRYKIDVVHGQSPSSFGYSLFAHKKVPFYVTAHSSSFGELSSFSNMPLKGINPRIIQDRLLIQPLTAFLTLIEYKFATKVVTVSKSTGQEVQQYYRLPSSKVIPIHNGVDPVSLDDGEKTENSRTLLYVGRLIWRKGVKYLIESMPNVLLDYPDTKLLIVGSGEQKKQLIDLVKSLKLENSVCFLGTVSAEKLYSLYHEAEIYLQPSIYEPCGLAILDAMSMGKPVIASRVGGIPELITHGEQGLLIEPSNSGQIAEAIKQVFADYAFRQRLGENARLKVEREFTWQIIVAKFFKSYQQVVSETAH